LRFSVFVRTLLTPPASFALATANRSKDCRNSGTRLRTLSSRPTTPLPESVRTALFISAARSKRNDPAVPQLTLSTTANPKEVAHGDAPRDCVLEQPSLSPGHVLLVTYDWRGIAQYKDEIPATEDLANWSSFLLKRCRRIFPRPLELVD
jgi:hypothetical protein